MGKLVSEFKEFVMRGNVMDLAVGVIIGGAFGSIVTSLCDDVIMPAIQYLIGTVAGIDDIDSMTAVLNVGPIKFGAFASAIINFLIMAVIIFAMVKAVNKLTSFAKKPEPEAAPTTKKCPFCASEIAIEAIRCPHCTSVLEIAEEALKEDEKK
ncbi:MAG: large conductance mechanosensitive channel protein MscL [Clostridia bacterium]|nr:large conductance mechanosensitive channel protein MscL [Clostridia bacterium]